MRTPSETAADHHRFRIIGAALMRVNLNNTHSGNMSCRDPRDAGRFWITASGAQCGGLSPTDLVAVRFDDMRHEGPGRPSSEANTHRRVLELPGANACVHSHAIATTLLGFETKQHPLFLHPAGPPGGYAEDCHFQPVDFWGAGLVGAVPVGVFRDTVGSIDMERRIPAYLRRAPVAIVKGHGPFARGQSLDECLHHLSVLENSAATAIALRRRGVDTAALQNALRSDSVQAAFACAPRRMGGLERGSDPGVEAALVGEFSRWLAYNFDLGLGAFGTGSMSRRLSADEMVFCPMSAAPENIGIALARISLDPSAPEADDVRLHRLVYSRTPFTACMLAASPLATAEAMAALASAAGIQALVGKSAASAGFEAGFPSVAPIDAEAAYHKVRLPVTSLPALARDAGGGLVARLLEAGNGCGLIAGCGVIAAGEHDLAQAAYRVSLAERVARFRLEVGLNHRLLGGPAPAAFE
jgi:ribulose-5-phosphate 4-epimerase/fuculose-1-phosphate aldolase